MPVNAPNDNLNVLAPSFNLKNINDNMVSLDNAKGLIESYMTLLQNHREQSSGNNFNLKF